MWSMACGYEQCKLRLFLILWIQYYLTTKDMYNLVVCHSSLILLLIGLTRHSSEVKQYIGKPTLGSYLSVCRTPANIMIGYISCSFNTFLTPDARACQDSDWRRLLIHIQWIIEHCNYLIRRRTYVYVCA